MQNLDQLRVLHAVAHTRSFTRAAEVLHLTQPGISKHIKQIEEEFRVRLFDRSGRTVTLTDAGAILFEATQEIMATLEAAERHIEDLKGLRGGRLRLGSSFPVGVYVLPPVLAEFRQQYPSVEVALEISLSDKIGPMLLANEIDLGLVSAEPRHSRLTARPFMTDELVVIVPRNHRWTAKRSVRPEEFADETFIISARGAGTRTVIEERLREQGIVLQNTMDFGNLEGVKHAVDAGLGVSIQARSVVEREIAAGSLHMLRIEGMNATIEFFYVLRRNAHLTHAARALVQLLEAVGAKKNG